MSTFTKSKKNMRRRNSFKSLNGFTLIEILIAVVVGIILLGGLIQIFILTKNNYRIQQGLNYMQENLRFAMGEVGYSARMGGFFYTVSQPTSVLATSAASIFGSAGGAAAIGAVQSSNELTVMPGLAANPGCGMLSWTVGIQGVNSSATPPSCISAGNYVAGTDLLFVSYLRPVFLGLPAITTPAIAAAGGANIIQGATNVAGTDIFPGDIYAIIFDPASKADVSAKQGGLIGTGALLTAPIRQASLFYDLSETDKIISNNRGNAGPPNLIKRGAAMMPLHVELYYIRPCAVLNAGAAACTATSDGGNPQPTLMRSRVVPLAGGVARVGNDEPIVSGIEQFQLEYSASGCAGYMNAAQVTAGTGCTAGFTVEQRWQRVTNIRIAMVARSNERANEIDTAVYNLSADTPAYTAATNIGQLPLNDRYRRRSMVSFSQPRNALRPLPPVNP